MGKRPRVRRLPLSSRQLQVLREVVDACLNVPAAMEVEQSVSRARALEHIHGTTTIEGRESFVKARAIDDSSPKRRSAPNATGTPIYRASHAASVVLRQLRRQVAASVGVETAALSPPVAGITMIAERFDFMRCVEREARECVRVALRNDTPALEFLDTNNQTLSARPMLAGEALLYNPRRWHREPQGDWCRTIDFTVDEPPLR